MNLFGQLVEQRMAETQARGEFDDLPGRPLQLHRDICEPEQLIREAEAVEQKSMLHKRLHTLLLQLQLQRPDNSLLNEITYLEKLNHRLEKP